MGGPRIPHKFIDGVEHKRCARCKEYKVLNAFSNNKRLWDKLSQSCKPCKAVTDRAYRKKYPKKAYIKGKLWRENNREKDRAAKRKHKKKYTLSGKYAAYQRNRYHTDHKYRLSNLLRKRLQGALKAQGVIKTTATLKLCGCTLDKLKQHLESQFTEGMSWEKKNFHIDHIRPVCSFDLSDVEEQKKCFHYTNLQPLWPIDNIKKGAKYDV